MKANQQREVEADTVLSVQLNDRPFNPWRTPKSDNVRLVIEEIIGMLQAYEEHFGLRQRKRKPTDQETFEQAVSAVLCDVMYHHLLGEPGGVAITRSNTVLGRKSRYRPSAYNKKLPAILDLMAAPEMAFITQEMGHQEHFSAARRTVIAAGSRTVDRIKANGIKLSDFCLADQREVVFLRREKDDFWDDGGNMEYDDTADTVKFREQLRQINQWLSAGNIDFGELSDTTRDRRVDPFDTHLRRIFTQGRFVSGGRLFGGFWQQLSKRDRFETVFIDEEEIVELDFGQMTPRILYGWAEVKPAGEDLYQVPGFEEHRAGIKQLFNAMVFSTKRLSRMPQGVRKSFLKEHSVEQVMRQIEKVHAPIAGYFFVGAGHGAQFIESNILVDVLLELKELGVTALPIHDAILVPRSKVATARSTMLEAFRRHTGIEGVVSVAEGEALG
ncbi:hypothetical protein Q669_10870 [Labrenzia sp. C1B10]|uniref:hypothetical protein n=1 Tax=unclassified Labrenzia TaxID=2648686 RepID=UPI0003B86555|nr:MULTISPECIES: hypothetical protein [unclassified Labrenzia]ERP87259.1 hypothetical protein Q669_10870 [Labrenzia sp. C1B10]ERS07563.1 hypothetical protein Q675_19505 [Labrenzia sp. C1B70]